MVLIRTAGKVAEGTLDQSRGNGIATGFKHNASRIAIKRLGGSCKPAFRSSEIQITPWRARPTGQKWGGGCGCIGSTGLGHGVRVEGCEVGRLDLKPLTAARDVSQRHWTSVSPGRGLLSEDVPHALVDLEKCRWSTSFLQPGPCQCLARSVKYIAVLVESAEAKASHRKRREASLFWLSSRCSACRLLCLKPSVVDSARTLGRLDRRGGRTRLPRAGRRSCCFRCSCALTPSLGFGPSSGLHDVWSSRRWGRRDRNGSLRIAVQGRARRAYPRKCGRHAGGDSRCWRGLHRLYGLVHSPSLSPATAPCCRSTSASTAPVALVTQGTPPSSSALMRFSGHQSGKALQKLENEGRATTDVITTCTLGLTPTCPAIPTTPPAAVVSTATGPPLSRRCIHIRWSATLRRGPPVGVPMQVLIGHLTK